MLGVYIYLIRNPMLSCSYVPPFGYYWLLNKETNKQITCRIIAVSVWVVPRGPCWPQVVQIHAWVVVDVQVIVGAPSVISEQQPVHPDASLAGNTAN